MKNQLILLAAIIAMTFSACNRQKPFRSDVNTDKKPWTNLEFNNNPDNFQFAIVSDRNGGCRPGIFEQAIKKLNLIQPEFVLSVGDLISGYTTDTAQITIQWAEVNRSISELQMPFFYLPGNHDITNKVMEKEWEKKFGRRYYSFIYKSALFLILDSNDDDEFNLTRKQTDFALNALKEYSGVRWTFVLMHHPIWNYKTDGRFEEIESALQGRKYTVIAGHEHHYHHAEKNGSNYYILSTTGAGSGLRGNYFGEFDHITWVTVANKGPVIANLRLDGILPHDISNDKTEALAKTLIENAALKSVLLSNQGGKFTNGTLYISVKNPTKSKLKISINLFHHHQLQIKNPNIQLDADPESNLIIEVPLGSAKPLDYHAIDLLLFDWQFKYDHPEYKEFALSGRTQMEVKPTQPAFIDKEINLFNDTVLVPFNHPFSNLATRVSINNSADHPYDHPIGLSQTSNLSFYLKNSKNEFSDSESRIFEKTTFLKATPVEEPREGLEYSYFEGDWKEMPDFSKLEAKSKGIANNFIVTDLSKRHDNWGLVFIGYLYLPDDQFTLFRVRADYACRLYIDGKLVVKDRNPAKGGDQGIIALSKGLHPVRIEYFTKSSDPKLRIFSKKAGEEDWKAADFKSFFH